jgi:hypothetical protein
MIIDNEREKKCMPCMTWWPRRGGDRVKRFVEAYHHIRNADVQMDLLEGYRERVVEVEWQTLKLLSLCHVVIFDKLYVVFRLIRVLLDKIFIL